MTEGVIIKGAKALWDFCNRHSNLIFGTLGVIGVAGTAVCTAVATKNAMDILREHEDEQLSTKEKVKLVWPEFIWAGLVAAGTGGTIVASNIMSARKAASLTAALVIAKEQLNTTRAVFDDYRQETLKYLPQDPEERKKIEKIIERRPKLEEGEKPKYIRDHLGDILHFKEVDTGIDEMAKPAWTWQRSDGLFTLSGLSVGTPVSLYDAGGMLISRLTADGTQLQFKVPARRVYILKVGNESIIIR